MRSHEPLMRRGSVRSAGILLAGAAVGVVAAWVVLAPDPKPEEPLPRFFREMFAAYKESAQREHGVLLSGNIGVRPAGDDADILFHWTLDYRGPRSPLTILRPSLEVPIETPPRPPSEPRTSCYLKFLPYAANAAEVRGDVPFVTGKQYPVVVSAPLATGAGGLAAEHFLTVQRGDVGMGTLTVRASQLREQMRAKWPAQLGAEPPALLFVALFHAPSDRGEAHILDAWTGRLRTELLPVPVDQLNSPGAAAGVPAEPRTVPAPGT